MSELNKNHIEVEIGDMEYICTIAYDDWEKEHGLMNNENLGDNEGMLFVYNEPQDNLSFWMKDTPTDLDIIFICPCFKVISVHTGIANSTDPITENNVQFVLEVKANSGIKEGEEVDVDGLEEFLEDKLKTYEDFTEINTQPDFDDNEKDKINILLKVINPDGETQLILKGEERIFSRPNTKILIKQAKKADKLKTDSTYKRLGKSIFKYMKIQDGKGEEFIKPKE